MVGLTGRPPRISAEDLAGWDELAAAWERENGLPPMMGRERFLEAFRAGQWLGEELDRLGDAEGDRGDQCFAMGQVHSAYMLIGQDDPWSAVLRTLKARASGRRLQPGPELAAELLRETLGVEVPPGDFPPMPGS